MALPPVGTRVIRADDGKIGVVRMEAGEPRVVYADRGNALVAPKKERWEAMEGPSPKLRAEEIAQVARIADEALRAVELHKPWTWWSLGDQGIPVHDAGLVAVVTRYLSER